MLIALQHSRSGPPYMLGKSFISEWAKKGSDLLVWIAVGGLLSQKPNPGHLYSVISFWKRTQPKEISECNGSVIRTECYSVVRYLFDLLLVYTSMWHCCDVWCVMMTWRWQWHKRDDLREKPWTRPLVCYEHFTATNKLAQRQRQIRLRVRTRL